MANPEHVKILKQGAEVWNRWREGSPEIRLAELHRVVSQRQNGVCG